MELVSFKNSVYSYESLFVEQGPTACVATVARGEGSLSDGSLVATLTERHLLWWLARSFGNSMFHFVNRHYKVQQPIVASVIFRNSVCQNLGVRGRKRRSLRIWLICLCASVMWWGKRKIYVLRVLKYSAVGVVSWLWVRRCGGLILQMPDQLWGPPCLLCSGYRFYFINAEFLKLTSHLSTVARMSGVTPLFPLFLHGVLLGQFYVYTLRLCVD